MVLHTIIGEYDILYAQDFSPEIKTDAISGGCVEHMNGAVQRLVSTDPSLFLDGRYQPGQNISK